MTRSFRIFRESATPVPVRSPAWKLARVEGEEKSKRAEKITTDSGGGRSDEERGEGHALLTWNV